MIARILLAMALLVSRATIAATAVIVDSSGASLGIPLRTATDPEQVTVVTRTGFIVNFVSSTGNVAANVQDAVGNQVFANQSFFESTDCTGPGFIPVGPTFSAIAGGVVMGADPSLWGAPIVYIHKNPFVRVRTLRSSRYVGMSCVDRSSFPYVAAAAVPIPNVPAITGVSGAAGLPMRMEIVSDCVFSNGFQCPND